MIIEENESSIKKVKYVYWPLTSQKFSYSSLYICINLFSNQFILNMAYSPLGYKWVP